MYAREGEVLDRPGWMSRLGLSAGEFDELAAMQLLTAFGDNWRLQFVGNVFFKKSAIACLPAPVMLERLEAFPRLHVEETANMLRRYQSRGAARRMSSDRLGSTPTFNESNRRAFREVEAFLGLIDFTRHYGFHTETSDTQGRPETAAVDWVRTIQRGMPVKCGKSLVYFQPQTRSGVPQTSRLGATQAKALLSLAKRYGDILGGTFERAYDLVDEAREVIQNSAHVELLTTKHDLLGAFDATNLDHERELAALLVSARSEDGAGRASDQSINVFGTTAFEQVWEDMCRVALGADIDVPGFELSNPHVRLTDGSVVRVRTQRPDITFCQDGQIFVIDAKYYPRFPQVAPALEDFRKQVFYVASAKGGNPKTAFCFPGHTPAGLERLGESTLRYKDGSVDTRFPEVALLRLDWRTAVDCYLSGRPDPNLRAQVALLLG